MKMKFLISVFLIVAIGATALMAADNTKRPHWYSDRGYSLSEMLVFGIDSSTVSGYQLKRRVNTVPITLITAGADSLESCVYAAPPGYTSTITGLFLTAFTEISGANDSVWGVVLWYNAGTLDTMVAPLWIDADSADYDKNLLELTRVDSVLAAGDVIFWQTVAWDGAATGAVGAALVVESLLDE